MLHSSNVILSLSEMELCLIIAGLYTVKGKQTDDHYKNYIQKLIDKVAKNQAIDK